MSDIALKPKTQDIIVDEVFPHAPKTIWKTLTSGELIGRGGTSVVELTKRIHRLIERGGTELLADAVQSHDAAAHLLSGPPVAVEQNHAVRWRGNASAETEHEQRLLQWLQHFGRFTPAHPMRHLHRDRSHIREPGLLHLFRAPGDCLIERR